MKKNNVIDMGKYSYRIKLLKMYRDPVYFIEQMYPEKELSFMQKFYLKSILGIDVEETTKRTDQT